MIRHDGKSAAPASYPQQLLEAIRRFLPSRGLPTLIDDDRVRWTPRLLCVAAILFACSGACTLVDRFEQARRVLGEMFPSRRRCGHSYRGFIAALLEQSQALLDLLTAHFQASVRALSQDQWLSEGFAVFGCDSSKIDCPMTAANEQHFGCSSRGGSWPQQLLTLIFHVGSGLPWCFMRGLAKASEREHLLAMLGHLPPQALLLADAGFTGYGLLAAILDTQRSFLIRVGANVRLLTKLGYCLREHEGIVYLWPEKARTRKHKPLVLRLIRLCDGRNRVMHLLCSVLDEPTLSDAQAARLYTRRWKVELLFRSLKQTLCRRKMLSDSPAHAQVELDWSVLGQWMLGLMAVQQIGQGGAKADQLSWAAALRVVRRVLDGAARAGGGRTLSCQLQAAVKDRYTRRHPKTARHWPHKKKDRPPGQPIARTATEAEIQLAQQLLTRKPAA